MFLTTVYLRTLSVFFLSYLTLYLTYAVKGSFEDTGSQSFGRLIHKNFGMAEGGIITMNYHVMAKNPLVPYTSYVLILILTEDEFNGWYGGLDTDKNVYGDMSNYCSLPSWKRLLILDADNYHGQFNMTVNSDSGSNRFSIALLQCKVGSSANPVTILFSYEMKNRRPTTPLEQQNNYQVDFLGDYSHLAIEDVNLERFYGGTIIMYTLLTVGMLAMIYHAK